MPEPTCAAEADRQTSDQQMPDPESPQQQADPMAVAEQIAGRQPATEVNRGDPGTASRLLMVTGPGRSGTSAITGALSQLGIHVPPPLVDWNRSNRRGFFETRWVVDFQRKVLTKAHTYEFDSDPRAIKRIGKVADKKTRRELAQWLKDAAEGHQQLVIKDPRSVWLHDLWVDAVEADGIVISYLTMLRHPTEVVGSRSAYYGTATDERKARNYAISKVAGWVNVSLLNERQTRNRPRVYLRYTDLLADWRTALRRVRDDIGLEFNAPLTPGEPNPVDDFISPELHRVRTSWDELDVPAELRQLAEDVWAACERLADEGGDADLDATFDALSERYDRLYRDAAAMVSDTISSAASRAAAEARSKTKKEITRKFSQAKHSIAKAEHQVVARVTHGPGTTEADPGETGRGEQAAIPAVAERAIRLGRRVARGVRRRLRR